MKTPKVKRIEDDKTWIRTKVPIDVAAALVILAARRGTSMHGLLLVELLRITAETRKAEQGLPTHVDELSHRRGRPRGPAAR